MIREREIRGLMRRCRSKEPLVAVSVFLLAAVITAFLTLIPQPPTAKSSIKARDDSTKIEEPSGFCIEDSTSQIEYDIIILVEAREHQKDQLCRLLKQLEIGANPRHVYIAFGGTNVEQVRKSLYECPTNAPTAVAYYLPEPLFQVLHTFGRDIDLGIANLYQALSAIDGLRPSVLLYEHLDIPRDFHDILTGALQAAIHDTASQRNSNQTTTTTATGSGPSRDLGFVISLESENNIVSRESNENAAQDETSESCIALQAIQRSWNSGAFVLSAKHALVVEMRNYLFARAIRDKYPGSVSDIMLDYFSLDPFLRDLRVGPKMYQAYSKNTKGGAPSSETTQRPQGDKYYIEPKASTSKQFPTPDFRASIFPPIAQPDSPCRKGQVTPLQGLKGHIERWQTFKEGAERIYSQNPSRVLDAQIQVSQIYSGYKKLGCTSIELRVPIAPQALQQFENTIIQKPLDQLNKESLKNFKPESMLEIGCGLGWTGAVLRSLYPSAKFVCIDLDINEDITSIQQSNLASTLGEPIQALAPSMLPARVVQNTTSTILDLDRLARELGIKMYEIEKFGLVQLNFWSLYMNVFGFHTSADKDSLIRLAELAIAVISENLWTLGCEIISIVGLSLFLDNGLQDALKPLIPVLKEANFEVLSTENDSSDHQLFVKRSPFSHLAREL